MTEEKIWRKRSAMGYEEPLIIEKSVAGQEGFQVCPEEPKVEPKKIIPDKLLRKAPLNLPEVGEQEVVRHYSRLSTWNYGVDHGFYPLGSCTMKYNPKLNEFTAGLPGFAGLHPESPEALSQGTLRTLGAAGKRAVGNLRDGRGDHPALRRSARRTHGHAPVPRIF